MLEINLMNCEKQVNKMKDFWMKLININKNTKQHLLEQLNTYRLNCWKMMYVDHKQIYGH